MRTPRAVVAIALVPLMLIASCAGGGSASDGGAPSLEDITWILDDPSTALLVDDPPAGARVTIRFTDGEIGGAAACNIYGGTYELGEQGAITLNVGSMTEMACEEPVMALESAVVVALAEVASFRFDGDDLVLEGEGIALTFAAEQPLPLRGTEWHLDALAAGGDAVTSTLAGTKATATFDDQGRVSGNASCNRYGGSYTLDGEAIAIDDVMSTAMACEPDVMEQEAAFLDGVGKAASVEIEGSTLTLLDADGAFLLSFVS